VDDRRRHRCQILGNFFIKKIINIKV